MIIKQKSIRTLNKLGVFKKYKNLHFIYEVKNINEELRKVGFEDLTVGNTIIPLPIGKYSSANIVGREVKRTDLPKIKKTVMYEWVQTDWGGGKNPMLSTRTVDAYPTDFIEPNNEELSIAIIDNKTYVITRCFSFDDENTLILANIMLECFGEFEVYDSKNNSIVGNKHKRLKWDILPRGDHPWEKVLERIKTNTQHLKSNEQIVIEKRLEILHKKDPDFVASGVDGFYGYFVFAYKDLGIYILESSRFNNATYIFEDDWESFSSLSKKEILDNNYHKDRIIHDKYWERKVFHLFSKKY